MANPITSLSQLIGINRSQITGLGAGSTPFTSVDGIGDFNGDGFSDIVVGSPVDFLGVVRSGTATVIYGRSGPFTSSNTVFTKG